MDKKLNFNIFHEKYMSTFLLNSAMAAANGLAATPTAQQLKSSTDISHGENLFVFCLFVFFVYLSVCLCVWEKPISIRETLGFRIPTFVIRVSHTNVCDTCDTWMGGCWKLMFQGSCIERQEHSLDKYKLIHKYTNTWKLMFQSSCIERQKHSLDKYKLIHKYTNTQIHES